jgi:hypothetical protein
MNPNTTRLYVVVRKELGDRQFVAHFGHAAREAFFAPPVTNALPVAPSEDEAIVVLRASKKQMEDLRVNLIAAGIAVKACVEIHGPMAGSTPSLGFAISEYQRSVVDPLVKDLKSWEPPAAAIAEEEFPPAAGSGCRA